VALTEELQLRAFRADAATHLSDNPWILPSRQFAVWSSFFDRLSAARASGLSPVVCVDLDLTSLLAPSKSRDVLAGLAPIASGLPVPGDLLVPMSGLLSAIWRGEEPALLPGYTTTSISAYGAYIVAQLQERTGQALADASRDACEAWAAGKVFDVLRSGYWNRDPSGDEASPGLTSWAARVRAQGGVIVFLSNRDPLFRNVSLASIGALLGEGVAPFAFFGPGGSQFDASSKAAAIARIEAGAVAGVHFGVENGGQTEYPDAPGAGVTVQETAIIAVVDDRAENRKQIIAAATASAGRLAQAGLTMPMDIASAAIGFCPEIDVTGMAAVTSSFAFEDAK
jgi:hypothetical protein